MSQHICLPLRTDPVTRVPADPLDCPLCRAVLLEAFRTSPDAPETPRSRVAGPFTRPALPEAGDGCLEPELCTPDDPCPVCERGHIMRARVQEAPSAPGRGFWDASCTCGWRKAGRWGGGTCLDRQAAQDTALYWVRHHRNETKENGS